jgi:CheY-like chemotaxis protein
MDGVELADRLRAPPGCHRLPLVLLNSIASPAPDGRRDPSAANAPFHRIVAKPVRPAALLEACAAALEKAAAPPAASEAVAPEGDRATSPAVGRILLAEDNRVNQKVALKLLERLGYAADVAENGREVVAALAKRRYDIVLMDVQMPEMDGLEATRRVRGDLPEESQPRIIAMTANATQEDRAACLAAGMDDFLSKPVAAAQLAAALERWTSAPASS